MFDVNAELLPGVKTCIVGESHRLNRGRASTRDGKVQPTHGVSVFDNPESCSCRGFVPHEIESESIPDNLQVIQRGKDPAHFEITPASPMAEDDCKGALGKIKTK